MQQYLFAYGTLLQPGNELAGYLAVHCAYIQPAKIKGALYDIGAYPGLVDGGDAYVTGSIYTVNAEALTLIDLYEGYGPDEDQPNLYLRIMKPVETATGNMDAWVYIYNFPVDGLEKIASGDYLKYSEQAKKPPRLLNNKRARGRSKQE